ncbi:hypothetical protein HYDPIDRAFT_110523, partial [Hydnomerulius pinastri MD-312]
VGTLQILVVWKRRSASSKYYKLLIAASFGAWPLGTACDGHIYDRSCRPTRETGNKVHVGVGARKHIYAASPRASRISPT